MKILRMLMTNYFDLSWPSTGVRGDGCHAADPGANHVSISHGGAQGD